VAYTEYDHKDDSKFGEHQRKGSGGIDCSRENIR